EREREREREPHTFQLKVRPGRAKQRELVVLPGYPSRSAATAAPDFTGGLLFVFRRVSSLSRILSEAELLAVPSVCAGDAGLSPRLGSSVPSPSWLLRGAH
ncbi:hypothetical protein AOLI_G00211560, partial [Acnodon oligacanthus]